MADKKVPQEECLMCGEFPCVCGDSERRTRFIKRQVETAARSSEPAGFLPNRDETDISGRNESRSRAGSDIPPTSPDSSHDGG